VPFLALNTLTHYTAKALKRFHLSSEIITKERMARGKPDSYPAEDEV
jgi:hypothetical protein